MKLEDLIKEPEFAKEVLNMIDGVLIINNNNSITDLKDDYSRVAFRELIAGEYFTDLDAQSRRDRYEEHEALNSLLGSLENFAYKHDLISEKLKKAK